MECIIIQMGKSLYSHDQNHLAERLKRARKDSGLDQEKAAMLLGKTQSYVSKIESGQRRVDVIELKGFAQIYKKSLEYFIKEK